MAAQLTGRRARTPHPTRRGRAARGATVRRSSPPTGTGRD